MRTVDLRGIVWSRKPVYAVAEKERKEGEDKLIVEAVFEIV